MHHSSRDGHCLPNINNNIMESPLSIEGSHAPLNNNNNNNNNHDDHSLVEGF